MKKILISLILLTILATGLCSAQMVLDKDSGVIYKTISFDEGRILVAIDFQGNYIDSMTSTQEKEITNLEIFTNDKGKKRLIIEEKYMNTEYLNVYDIGNILEDGFTASYTYFSYDLETNEMAFLGDGRLEDVALLSEESVSSDTAAEENPSRTGRLNSNRAPTQEGFRFWRPRTWF